MHRRCWLLILLLPLVARADENPRPRFALSLFHFNIEFVAGDRAAEDAIVRESFEPVLELYRKHPTWGVDLELQGYMLDVLRERHPAVLGKLRALAARGQADVDCVHYSDQLLLAYPLRDMQVSLALARRAFAQARVPLGPTAFSQEAQVGPGYHRLLAREGYDCLLWTSGNWEFFFPQRKPSAPWYADGPARIVVTRAVSHPRVETRWTFVGDGEKLATGSNPYGRYGWGKPFRHDPARVAAHERGLVELERAGWRIARVRDLAAHLRRAKIAPETLGPVTETARGKGTENVFLWMGKHVLPFEQDVAVLTRAYRARCEVLAAETLLEHAARQRVAVDDLRPKLREAWRSALFAQVSDATGQAPFPVEIRHALEAARRATEQAAQLIGALKGRLAEKAELEIDCGAGTAGPPRPAPATRPLARAPLALQVSPASARRSARWLQIDRVRQDVTFEFFHLAGLLQDVSIGFPLERRGFAYATALDESGLQRYDLSRAGFAAVYLPLPSGLVRLGSRRWLVKHNRVGHVAARVSPSDDHVRFNLRLPPPRRYRFRFSLIAGDEAAALAAARRINTHPVLVR